VLVFVTRRTRSKDTTAKTTNEKDLKNKFHNYLQGKKPKIKGKN